MQICSYCDNEFEGEALACAKCDDARFCSETCQVAHLNDEHGDDD